MATAQKKVVVRLKGGSLAWGYLPQGDFVTHEPTGVDRVDLIEVDARAKPIEICEIVAIFYVKDFNLQDREEPERLGKRSFLLRPRGEGLWVRLEFHEMAALEGLLQFDTTFMDELLSDKGVFLTPPDGRSNTVKIFVPRSSIRTMEVLGWVSSPTKKLAAKTARQAALEMQAGLFEEQG
jgi:hypothetical protein